MLASVERRQRADERLSSVDSRKPTPDDKSILSGRRLVRASAASVRLSRPGCPRRPARAPKATPTEFNLPSGDRSACVG